MKSVAFIAVLVAFAEAVGDQNPKWLDAQDNLRGRKPLTVKEQQHLFEAATPGKDYPLNSQIPEVPASLDKSKAGYYADDSGVSRCQAFHRVDNNGEVTSYLCTNQSVRAANLYNIL